MRFLLFFAIGLIGAYIALDMLVDVLRDATMGYGIFDPKTAMWFNMSEILDAHGAISTQFLGWIGNWFMRYPFETAAGVLSVTYKFVAVAVALCWAATKIDWSKPSVVAKKA